MSDSVQPHRRQPTRLPHPWDSPGKNTGVGCHFLLQCMKVKRESEVAQSCLTLSDPMDCRLPGSSVHGIFQARGLEWGAIAFSAFVSRYFFLNFLFDFFSDPLVTSVQFSHSVMSDSVRPHRQQPTRLCRPWDSPGKNTGVSCHFLLQCMKEKRK